MKADLQLRHKLFGRQGSMWERQLDDPTRARIRRIVKEGGNAPTLAGIDQIAASATNRTKLLVEDEFFRFVDGNFAVVGQIQSNYLHHYVKMDTGERLHVAYRPVLSTKSSTATLTKLARVSKDFISAIENDEALDSSRDWYLVPVPKNLEPVVLQGRNEDEYLVQGIDFITRDGYIAMVDSPTDVLPFGLVRVYSGYKHVTTTNNYVLSAPGDRRGNRYLSEYAHRSQSLASFRRAAAEYAGLYVFQEPDVVLSVVEFEGDHKAYSMANAGVVDIKYPHQALVKHQEIPPGLVICDRLDIISSEHGATDNTKKNATKDWETPLVLDGILPVNGLTWDSQSGLLLFDSEETDPDSGKPHMRARFLGSAYDLERYWEASKLHERATGDFLHDALGTPNLPTVQNFWDMLETFYKSQLVLVLSGDHGARINSRLWKFILEHHPMSCSVVWSIPLTSSYAILYDDDGVPMVDGDGAYVAADDLAAECPVYYLAYGELLLAYGGDPLGLEVCE